MRFTLLLVLAVAACGTSTERPAPTEQPPNPTVARGVLGALAAFPAARPHLGVGRTLTDATTLRATLPREANGAARLTSRERSDVWIELRAEGLAPVVGSVVDGAIVYPRAAEATDVVWVHEGHRVEEWRLLANDSAPRTARYSLRVGAGVAEVRQRVGRVEILDANGRVHLTTDDLVAYDAKGVRRSLRVDVMHQGSEYTVSLALDASGLEYPIAVDPAWTNSPLMIEGRGNHGTVGLPDGRLLVIGGFGGGGALELTTTEVYNPATNTFISAGSNAQGECQAIAMTTAGTVLRAGGMTKLGPINSAALFDPATTSWSSLAAMPYRYCDGAAVALDATRFLVMGGSNSSGANGADTVLYNTATGGWSILARMSIARNGHTATLLADGTVFVTGGNSLGSAVASTERYNVGTNTWTAGPAMKLARSGHSATRLASGKVLIVGGGTATQLFDPAAGTFSDGGALAAGRNGHTATLLSDGRVLVAGGGTKAAEMYDPATNTSGPAGTMVDTRASFGSGGITLGRVMATGDYSSATNTTEIWGALIADTCTANYECVSGHCVDGVCCTTACAAGTTCNNPGKVGTCTKPIGGACAANAECASNFCVDGVCCNSGCTAQCSACNVAGKVGTCSPVLGAPVGGRAACTGTGVGTTCGPRCDGYDGAACKFPPTTTSCGADACSAGVETHVGTCDGAGVCTTTSKVCGDYVCGGTACLTTCTTTTDCKPGLHCKGTTCVPASDLGSPCAASTDCSTKFCADGFCCEKDACGVDASCGLPGHEGVCRTKQGRTCTKDAECGTDHCADGVCCNSVCDGQCEACDVEAKAGVCSPVSGDPHGTRAKCDDGGTDVCKAKTCKGASDRTACVGFVNGPTKTCAPTKCDGSSFTPISTCDGAGACTTPKGSSCVPYKCDPKGCLDKCSSNDQCATGYYCLGGRCEPKSATCTDDGLGSIGRDDVKADCRPYRCLDTGECGGKCLTTSDCAPEFACEVASGVCQPAAPTESGGGCTHGGGRPGSFAGLAFLLAGVLVGLRRRASLAVSGAVVAVAVVGCSEGQRVPPPEPAPTAPRRIVLEAIAAQPVFAARLAEAHPLALDPSGTAALSTAAHTPIQARLPLSSTGPLRLSPPGHDAAWIDVRSADGVSVKGEVLAAAVAYADAAIDTDLVHLVGPFGEEELRTLRTARAPTTFTYRITHGPGVAKVRLRDRRIEAVDASGWVHLASAPMFAIDAKGVRRHLELRQTSDETFVARLDTDGLVHPIVVDPAWSVAASMAAQRVIAAAVTLTDGRFMVIGGDGASAGNSAEVYDPKTNTWTSTLALSGSYGSYPDWEPAAALLPSGKALVRFGGAERWDPTTNAWSAAGAATINRTTATPLKGGKVLAVCGTSYTDSASTAELYDETTNAWTATASMATQRGQCTAIALPDGRALVAGGLPPASTTPMSTAEIFDAATGKWTATGAMVNAATRRTAIVHSNGKVYFAGPGTKAEVYDPATGTFSALAASSALHHRGGVAELLNGQLLVVGGVITGSGGNFTAGSDAELFDPKTNTWSTAGAMAAPRAFFPAFRLPTGRVLVAGGASKATGIYGVFPTSSAELFGGTLGTTCTASWECASTHCVDGVCCGTSTCPFAAVCNTKLKAGTCAKVNGLACTAGTECESGSCADGFCCDLACKGLCEACDLPAKVGICSPVLGPPRGTRGPCSGGKDPLCGDRCDGADRLACHFPGAAAACGADSCTGGIESHASTCDATGKCGDKPKSCAGYACGATTCKTSCATKADCAAGYQCKTSVCVPVDGLGAPCKVAADCSTGFCTDGVCCGVALCDVGSSCATPEKKGACAKVHGTSCTAAAECSSDQCVDGVCCDRACDGQCEACDVAGKVGSCAPVGGDPHGARAKCGDGAGDPCKAATCDGAKDATKCVAFAKGTETTCKASSCLGTVFTAPSTCTGGGACAAPAPQECFPYACDAVGCRVSCAKKEHCAPTATCVKGACQAIIATCSADRLSSTAKDGAVTDCRPYRCTSTGACGSQCATSADCAPGSACDLTAKTCSALAAADSSGGCAVSSPAAPRAWVLLGLLALAGRRHRRQHAPVRLRGR